MIPRRSACACASVTPSFNRPATVSHGVCRSVRVGDSLRRGSFSSGSQRSGSYSPPGPWNPSGRTPTIEKRLPFNDSVRPAIDSPPLRRSFQKRSETTTARSELPPSETVSVRPMIGLARIVSM